MTQPAFTPAAFYRDPRAALDWLQAAFGFELEMLLEDETGALAHSELRHGDGLLMVGPEWSDDHRSPASLGGKCTQALHVRVAGLDAHFERACAAGAEIIAPPQKQFYGDRTYRARDPEGHIWTFCETVEVVQPAEWDARTGLRTTLGPGYAARTSEPA